MIRTIYLFLTLLNVIYSLDKCAVINSNNKGLVEYEIKQYNDRVICTVTIECDGFRNNVFRIATNKQIPLTDVELVCGKSQQSYPLGKLLATRLPGPLELFWSKGHHVCKIKATEFKDDLPCSNNTPPAGPPRSTPTPVVPLPNTPSHNMNKVDPSSTPNSTINAMADAPSTSEPPTYFWISVGTGIGVCLVIFVAAVVCCIVSHYRRKLKKTREALNEIRHTNNRQENPDTARYSAPPKKNSNQKDNSTDTEERIYQSVTDIRKAADEESNFRGTAAPMSPMSRRPRMPLPHEARNHKFASIGKASRLPNGMQIERDKFASFGKNTRLRFENQAENHFGSVGKLSTRPHEFERDHFGSVGKPSTRPHEFERDHFGSVGKPSTRPHEFEREHFGSVGKPSTRPHEFEREHFGSVGKPSTRPHEFERDHFGSIGKPSTLPHGNEKLSLPRTPKVKPLFEDREMHTDSTPIPLSYASRPNRPMMQNPLMSEIQVKLQKRNDLIVSSSSNLPGLSPVPPTSPLMPIKRSPKPLMSSSSNLSGLPSGSPTLPLKGIKKSPRPLPEVPRRPTVKTKPIPPTPVYESDRPISNDDDEWNYEDLQKINMYNI